MSLRTEPAWLTLEDIIDINRDAVALSLEPHWILNQGLVESAWKRPEQHWHYGEDDVVVLAVVLLMGIAQNHGFEQGNKRTAFTAAVMFLRLNGYELLAPDSEDLGEFVRLGVTGEVSEEEFMATLRSWVAPVD